MSFDDKDDKEEHCEIIDIFFNTTLAYLIKYHNLIQYFIV